MLVANTWGLIETRQQVHIKGCRSLRRPCDAGAPSQISVLVFVSHALNQACTEADRQAYTVVDHQACTLADHSPVLSRCV